jgi:hypothetical protein
MTIEQLLSAILLSQPCDWHAEELTSHDGHAWVATLKADISIKIQWGRTCMPDFDEPWIWKFPNHECASEYAEVLHQGSVVFHEVYVAADGGRVLFPMPDITTLEVPTNKLQFVALLNALSRNDPAWFSACVGLARVTETDEDWPKF